MLLEKHILPGTGTAAGGASGDGDAWQILVLGFSSRAPGCDFEPACTISRTIRDRCGRCWAGSDFADKTH